MKAYLVGGAVRDSLLGLSVKEKDWVVVGESPEALLSQGYVAVGKDFPVFLHPKTKEEYALARTEKKIGKGYHGFKCHATPEVTLEEDLERRDLTINAMALNEKNELVDPFGGQQDLQKKQLRHVSTAFVEDPLRVLRVARFYARFAHLGFQIAEDTQRLMTNMVKAGELAHLVPERVWKEIQKALSAEKPQCFFQALRDCGGLAVLLPELDKLYGVPQDKAWHPEVDTGVHTLLVLEQAALLSPDPCVRFAALLHDLGKGLTSPSLWPKHPGHEAASLPLVKQLCRRLRVPKAYEALALLAARWHGQCHNILALPSEHVLELLEAVDAFRRPERFVDFLLVCEADSRGRTGFEQQSYPQRAFLQQALATACAIKGASLKAQDLQGLELASALREKRVKAIATLPRA